MLSHAELKAKALSNPAVKAEYDRLAPEMALLDEFLRAREAAGLTQSQVAAHTNTQPPVIFNEE